MMSVSYANHFAANPTSSRSDTGESELLQNRIHFHFRAQRNCRIHVAANVVQARVHFIFWPTAELAPGKGQPWPLEQSEKGEYDTRTHLVAITKQHVGYK